MNKAMFDRDDDLILDHRRGVIDRTLVDLRGYLSELKAGEASPVRHRGRPGVTVGLLGARHIPPVPAPGNGCLCPRARLAG